MRTIRSAALLLAVSLPLHAQAIRQMTRVTPTTGFADSTLFACTDSTKVFARACKFSDLQKRLAFKSFDSLVAVNVRVGNGSSATPSIAFANSTGSGFYRFGADTLGIALGGNAAMLFPSTSKMSGATGNMTIQAGLGNSRTITLQGTDAGGVARTALVGIDSQAQAPNGRAGKPGFAFTGDGTMGMYRSATNTLGWATSGVESMTLTGGASATIVGGAGNMTIQAGTGNSRQFALQTTTNAGTATTAVRFNEIQQSLFQNGTGAAPGISWGTDSLTGFLHASTGATATQSYIVNGQSIFSAKRDSIFILRNVNMGANAATAAADVNLCIKTTGTAGTVTQGATCGTSSAKVKTNIGSIFDPVAKTMALRPVSYSYIPGIYGGRHEYGLVADSTMAVDSTLVFRAEHDDPLPNGLTIKKGDALNVNDRAVLSLLIATVQQQQRDIDSLKVALRRGKP